MFEGFEKQNQILTHENLCIENVIMLPHAPCALCTKTHIIMQDMFALKADSIHLSTTVRTTCAFAYDVCTGEVAAFAI